MSTTLIPTKVPLDYYNKEKINFIRNEVSRLLSFNFKKTTLISDQDIKRILMRVLEERLEEDDKMTQRAIMYLVNEVKAHHIDRLRALYWEDLFPHVNQVYDNISKIGPDMGLYKPSKQASTLRFYFSSGF